MNLSLIPASIYCLIALVNLQGIYSRSALGNHQTESTIAQTLSDEEQSQCETALLDAVNTIQDGRAVQVVGITSVDLSTRYSDYPTDAPLGVIIQMEGQATADVLSSDQFMTSVSTGIIQQCGPVSLVDFDMNGTDWTVVYGLVNGTVAQFECLTPGPSPDAKWGQEFCM
ncbi:MAG: hypothetical protein AAFY76_25515 [Cyanobacteria bacterium J06649_11]